MSAPSTNGHGSAIDPHSGGAPSIPTAPAATGQGGRRGPLIRYTLSTQVVDMLKGRILSLELEPGTRLLTDVLAEELGVSRTPVREGLKELVKEGLVSYDGKSYAVRVFSRKDAEEILSIRMALEVLAARQAAINITDPVLQELRSLQSLYGQQLESGDRLGLADSDFRFHERIADACLNTRLRMLTDSLREQIFLSHRWSFHPEQLRETQAEHGRILQALERRDPAGAAAAMEEHLQRVTERTLARL